MFHMHTCRNAFLTSPLKESGKALPHDRYRYVSARDTLRLFGWRPTIE